MTPTNDVMTKPASVNTTTASANTGTAGRGIGSIGRAARPQVRGEHPCETRHIRRAIATIQGSAISAANRVKDRPLAAKASRLVRLDTGSSSDAELARCVHA